MEIANLDNAAIRLATTRDAQEILRLLNEAAYTHIHADWHTPGEWLDTPGFVITERSAVSRSLSYFGQKGREITACLAVAADPCPAAWVRLAAMRRPALAEETLAVMLEAVLPHLQATGVTELGWLAVEAWPDEMLPVLGFRRVNWITTFLKEGLDFPPVSDNGVKIRPARIEEMDRLADIEVEAFDPLWRHSAEGLRLAYHQSICFDVALVNDRIVGFQYSAANQNRSSAHLVRITIHPAYQRGGVGSALLKAAFHHYRRQGLRRVSLNTQLDNIASHRLYENFGFYRTGDQMPVWVREIERI